MFRKPREDASSSNVKGSLGRPPTPPSDRKSIKDQQQRPVSDIPTARMLSRKPMAATNGLAKSHSGSKPKPNGNILRFFKKAERPEENLFVKDSTPPTIDLTSPAKGSVSQPQNGPTLEGMSRYNENGSPVKRRRLDSSDPATENPISTDQDVELQPASPIAHGQSAGKGQRKRSDGPFFEDSDSDTERVTHLENEATPIEPHSKDEDRAGALDVSMYDLQNGLDGPQDGVDDPQNGIDDLPNGTAATKLREATPLEQYRFPKSEAEEAQGDSDAIGLPQAPPLRREQTSMAEDDEFGLLGDFADDEFPEDGDEQMERRWMEEQLKLEEDFEEDDVPVSEQVQTQNQDRAAQKGSDDAVSCPICEAKLHGLSAEQASIHVNGCLDGKPVPLPLSKDESAGHEDGKASPNGRSPNEEVSNGPSHKRFQRAAIPRPAQANPFSASTPNAPGSSAFSRIMSSHAEDAAWATAAANDVAARGKPAFQRTCPFYKILPGMATCVDAFRYGAVEGCRAYFLSHFHSDHYIGLTASWCHGPIYCSRVTGNLVRQQLRVDPKWVVDLEWEKETEVPDTQGVRVTMIPANHCPGSSLYLFEKTMGGGKNPKAQRVLHCGDFRACPMHVKHPLLRPEVQDAVTGKNRQQKLDVCYLDTTYLTPKYAFPSQEAVIKACADMCVSLSKDKVDASDVWEQTKRARAGGSMTKFLHTGGTDDSPKETTDPPGAAAAPGRGRLLVVVGTYSIGKERICLGIARALRSKIFAAPAKQRICRALEDPELLALLTSDPREAQVHMQMLMEIRAETLADYLRDLRPHFSRIVGFRPSGWNYRPPGGRLLDNPPVPTVLRSEQWRPKYGMAELVPQRGSTREASCFGVPYSEHSSFRELTMFACALRIDRIIPTVNVGSAKSREKMKGWVEKWAAEKKKNGLFRVEGDGQTWP